VMVSMTLSALETVRGADKTRIRLTRE